MLSENIIKKFGVAIDDRILLRNPPPGVREQLLEILPPGVVLLEASGKAPLDLVLWWLQELAGLTDALADLAQSIRPDGAVWLLIAKKKYAAQRGLRFSWQQMQAAALETDLVDNTVASFSETDYGTRFVIRREHRHRYRGAA